MNDRELLELAAKAAGIEIKMFTPPKRIGESTQLPLIGDDLIPWNPLTDDRDALRLAVRLRFEILVFPSYVRVITSNIDELLEYCTSSDPYAATRRAIVRAAAEIGKAMK